MSCTACSHENAPRIPVCPACSADLAADREFEARTMATVETRLAALTQRILATHVTSAQRSLAEPTGPALDVGLVRLVFGDPCGSRIETPAGPAPCVPPARGSAIFAPPLPSDVRPQTTAAIWAALSGAAPCVRIDAAPGAGATTLLYRLAAGAIDRGFSAGAVVLADANGPARDIAQRLATQLDREGRFRYYAASELATGFAGLRCLALLDDANLTAADLTELANRFPSFGFVVIDRSTPALPAAAAPLPPLPPDPAIALLEDAYGRPIDAENRAVAREIAAEIGMQPGRVRLMGIAARERQRSFISARMQYDSGEALVHELLATLPPTERDILTALAAARVPFAAHQLAYIIRETDVGAALEHLQACDLIRTVDDSYFALPRYVARLLAAVPGTAAIATDVRARIVDVLVDAFDPRRAEAVDERQLFAAAAWLATAGEHYSSSHIVAVGARLGDVLGSRGAFGAWARVLTTVADHAQRAGEIAARDRARHDLGVRAILLDEAIGASAIAEPIAHDRQSFGEQAATAAAVALPPIVPAEMPGRYARPLLLATLALLAFAIGAGAIFRFAPVAPRQTPTFRAFSASPLKIAGGQSSRVCVDAVGEAVVEIFPAAARLPGNGTNCLTVRPTLTTTYVAVATAADGRQTRNAVTVAVNAAAPPAVRILDFSATPARIVAGQSTQLCYAVVGAHQLHIVPRVGTLTRLRECRPITLRTPHRYRYTLSAAGDGGFTARAVVIDVVAPTPTPARRQAAAHDVAARRLPQRAIYQFDATPSSVERGQIASLCVGVDRTARGYVTALGRLTPGITRCYRVAPRTTTVYRLYVAVDRVTAVESLTVAVHPALHRSRNSAANAYTPATGRQAFLPGV